jgi:predicted small secreted protein
MKNGIYIVAVSLILSLCLTQCSATTEVAGNDAQSHEQRGGKTIAEVNETPTADDPLEIPVEVSLNGEYVKAFLAAHEAMKAESLIPEEKKRIENYIVDFRQSGSNYLVLFRAKRKPQESELDGGESELGQDVIYTVSKADYRVVKRLFYK